MTSTSGPPGYEWSDLWQRWIPPRPGPGWKYYLWGNTWIRPEASSPANEHETVRKITLVDASALCADSANINFGNAGANFTGDEQETDEEIIDAISSWASREDDLFRLMPCVDAAAVRAHVVSTSSQRAARDPTCLVRHMLDDLGSNHEAWPALLVALRMAFAMLLVRQEMDQQATGKKQNIHQSRAFDRPWLDMFEHAIKFVLARPDGCREVCIHALTVAELDFASLLSSLWKSICYSSVGLQTTLATQVRDAMGRRQDFQKMKEPPPNHAQRRSLTDAQATWIEAAELQLTPDEYWERMYKTSEWFREHPKDLVIAARLLENAADRQLQGDWKYIDSLQRLQQIASNGIVWNWLISRIGDMICTCLNELLDKAPSSAALPEQVSSFVAASPPDVGHVMLKLNPVDQVSVMARGCIMSCSQAPISVLRSRLHQQLERRSQHFHAHCNNVQMASLYQMLSLRELQAEAEARRIPLSRAAQKVCAKIQELLEKSDDDIVAHALIQQNLVEERLLLQASKLLQDLSESDTERLQMLNKIDYKNEVLFVDLRNYSAQQLQNIVRAMRLKTQRHPRIAHWQAAIENYVARRKVWLGRVRERENSAQVRSPAWRKEGPDVCGALSCYYRSLSFTELESEFQARGLIKPTTPCDATPAAVAEHYFAALCASDKQWFEIYPVSGYHDMSWKETRRLVVEMHIQRSWRQGEQQLTDLVAALEKFERRRLHLYRLVQKPS